RRCAWVAATRWRWWWSACDGPRPALEAALAGVLPLVRSAGVAGLVRSFRLRQAGVAAAGSVPRPAAGRAPGRRSGRPYPCTSIPTWRRARRAAGMDDARPRRDRRGRQRHSVASADVRLSELPPEQARVAGVAHRAVPARGPRWTGLGR